MQISSDKPKVKSLAGITYEIPSACGPVYITCNGEPLFEVFVRLGKAGGCAMALCESIGKLISHYLQKGGSPDVIIRQLSGVSCHQAGVQPSCVSVVANAIEEHLNKENKE